MLEGWQHTCFFMEIQLIIVSSGSSKITDSIFSNFELLICFNEITKLW